MKKKSVVCILGLAIGLEVVAAPRLPGFFSDNMVLQREREVTLWGWANPEERLSVNFAEVTVEAVADERGTWRAVLPPLPASTTGRVLSVGSLSDEAPSISLENVVVGDVWICSGQSNMEWTLSRTKGAEADIKAADYPLIRHMKVQKATADLPVDDLNGAWQVCTPESVRQFSAVGYFFARHLHQELGVPIGLVGSNWGGTRIEPWTPQEGFAAVPELADIAHLLDASQPATEAGRIAHLRTISELREWIPLAEAAIDQGLHPPAIPKLPSRGTGHQAPTRIYNAMIDPIIPFAIRGVIWYQGESNRGEGLSYHHRKQALIGGWRKLWGQGDFPFYFVQLASFGQPNENPAGGDGFTFVRDAQLKSLSITNTGMAVAIDIGEAGDIHPRNKQDVGLRLALWAMGNEYGRDGLVYSGPLYKGFSVDDGSIRITFDHVGAGLMVGEKTGLTPVKEVPGGTLRRFAIAGTDQQWHWADARIDGADRVVVSSPAVPNPVAVRYAFSHNPEGCNLYNSAGLPASPFRTDDW